MTRYFTDAVLFAPVVGSMLMCMASALVGVLVFVRKRSLLGEALSHAAYPGVMMAAFVTPFFQEEFLVIEVLIGAALSSLFALFAIEWLQKKKKISSDASLCLILSLFFALGVTLASRLQFLLPQEYKQVQSYLFGQAATMTGEYLALYALLTGAVILLIVFFYKELKVIGFDLPYAQSLGIRTKFVEAITYFLIVMAVVIGIRSIGVVLMSAMLIAPAVAARQYTHSLKSMFVLAACIGTGSGFFGNYLSFELSTAKLSFPTGPMIVLTSSVVALFALLFAPQKGVVIRMMRIRIFRLRCQEENLLKALWRAKQPQKASFFLLTKLKKQGFVSREGTLTAKGKLRAEHIVRLHRLWEVYLAHFLQTPKERVHKSAEEMEHILTPELETTLTKLLGNPKYDPHHQLIPSPHELS